MTFILHTKESAPEKSKSLLEKVEREQGFIPNGYRAMAEAPSVLKACMDIQERFAKEVSFTPMEQAVVLMTVDSWNDCEYCMAHDTIMAQERNLSPQVIKAIRAGLMIHDSKLEALRQYTKSVLEHAGHPSKAAKERFLDAGYQPRQALELLIGISLCTLTNYATKMTRIPLDEAFKEARWSSLYKAA